MPKWLNPANVPKARPIEDFWGNLKQKVYEKDWRARNLQQLEQKIKPCLKKWTRSLSRDMLEQWPKDWTIFVDMVSK